jgi:hypothetical protein
MTPGVILVGFRPLQLGGAEDGARAPPAGSVPAEPALTELQEVLTDKIEIGKIEIGSYYVK